MFTIGRNLTKFWPKISLHSFFTHGVEYVRDVSTPPAQGSVIVCVKSFSVTRQAAPTLQNKTWDTKWPAAHRTKATFELGLSFDPRMMSWKFGDDTSNGSWVIVLTDRHPDKQTKSQTDTTENNTTLSTLRCAGSNDSQSCNTIFISVQRSGVINLTD